MRRAARCSARARSCPELHSQAPIAGDDLVLSIDLATQQAAEDALGDHRGAVVAIDPGQRRRAGAGEQAGLRSGGLRPRPLAQPSTRALADNIDKPLFNRALRGTYPSGSTIKPAIALAGTHLSRGGSEPPGILRRRVPPAGQQPPVSRRQGRQARLRRSGRMRSRSSCDVYFYGLACDHRRRTHRDLPRAFRLRRSSPASTSAARSRACCPRPSGRSKAFKRPQDQIWFPGETVNFGVGQGYLLVTPLQLAHVAAVLAERGKSFQPRLVTGVRDLEGHVQADCAGRSCRPIDGVTDAAWDLVLRRHDGRDAPTAPPRRSARAPAT